jgi:Flp pilus assembly protein TadD
VAAGVAPPAPALELTAVGGTRIRLDAAHARPLLVAVTSPDTKEALAAQARALEESDVVLVDGAATDDAIARARTVCALISELATGEHAVPPLFRIDRDGFVDVVGVRVTLAQLRDWRLVADPARAADRFANGEALGALPRAELAARLPNLALAALAKLEAAGATGLDVEFGLALTDTRKFPEAMARFAKAPTSDPELAPALVELGRKLTKLSRSPEARAAFERAVAVAPADANARFELGRLFLLSKDKEIVEAGTESLRVATYLKPDFADAQYAFGQGLSRVGRRDEAITALERALALDPDAVQAKAARDLLDSLRAKKNS